MIEVSGLTVRFGGVTSLDAMDIRFEQGTCGLIGPNGAGKTTLFNVITGLQAPTAGRVFLDEHDVTDLRPHQRDRKIPWNDGAADADRLFQHHSIHFVVREWNVGSTNL